jgi:hypothetical protein
MYIEPNCDMLWEVYLDWLQDQGNEDLRFVCAAFLISVDEYRLYHDWHDNIGLGEGYYDNSYNVESLDSIDRLRFSFGSGSYLGDLNVDFMRADGSI